MVYYKYQWDESGYLIVETKPPAPAWLREFVGDDLLLDVAAVGFPDSKRVGNVVLEHLAGLTKLRCLFLNGTLVTDVGLENLKGLTELESLGLVATQITDVGLEHLTSLRNLERLDLDGTHVTEQGIEGLQKALPNCEIHWDDPNN